MIHRFLVVFGGWGKRRKNKVKKKKKKGNIAIRNSEGSRMAIFRL